jgi:TetR/AcrR family transcriptional regulator
VQTMIRRYDERLRVLIEDGKASGELDPQLDAAAAATLFIGSIQGLVMQAMLLGDSKQMRKSAPGAFAIYRRGISSARS